MFDAIMNRVKNLFSMGITTRVETGIAQVKLATGIVTDRIKRIHNYGFMSRPLPGSKGYLLFVGGDTSRGVAVCIEDERYEIELEPGDVAVLDHRGNVIHLNNNGINVTSPAAVTLNAPTTTITSTTTINGPTTINGETAINGVTNIVGATTVNGKINNSGGVSIDGIEFDQHVHAENDQQGTTGTPE